MGGNLFFLRFLRMEWVLLSKVWVWLCWLWEMRVSVCVNMFDVKSFIFCWMMCGWGGMGWELFYDFFEFEVGSMVIVRSEG